MNDPQDEAEFAQVMKQFVAERDAAFLSMEMKQLLEFGDKWGVNWNVVPGEEERFWISVHMARTGAKSLPLEERMQSKAWLTVRGYRTLDDGELP